MNIKFLETPTKCRSGSRTAGTSKVKLFVIIVNGFQPLTITTKGSPLDVAAVLNPSLDFLNFRNPKICTDIFATSILMYSLRLTMNLRIRFRSLFENVIPIRTVTREKSFHLKIFRLIRDKNYSMSTNATFASEKKTFSFSNKYIIPHFIFL